MLLDNHLSSGHLWRIPDSLVAHPSRTLRRAGERSVGHHHTSVADIAAGADRRRRISRTCGLVRPTRTTDLEDAHNGRQPGRRHGLQQVARNLSRADVERPQAARFQAVREVHIMIQHTEHSQREMTNAEAGVVGAVLGFGLIALLLYLAVDRYHIRKEQLVEAALYLFVMA